MCEILNKLVKKMCFSLGWKFLCCLFVIFLRRDRPFSRNASVTREWALSLIQKNARKYCHNVTFDALPAKQKCVRNVSYTRWLIITLETTSTLKKQEPLFFVGYRVNNFMVAPMSADYAMMRVGIHFPETMKVHTLYCLANWKFQDKRVILCVIQLSGSHNW